MKIVLFSGRAGVGKDHMCQLVQDAFGFRQLGFSDVGKWYGVGRGWWTWEECYVTKPPHVRTRMQTKLTEEHRDAVDPLVWVKAFFAMSHTLDMRFGGFDKIVMMDGRFINEVASVQEVGGLVIRLVTNDPYTGSLTQAQHEHQSESELDSFDFQHVVDNSQTRWPLANIEVYSLVWEYLNDEDQPIRWEQCCTRDTDGDGNCPVHSAPGVFRNPEFNV